MADNTKIEWADATVNAVNGCSVLSPGCTNCYAMKQAHRFEARRGLTTKTKGGMVWTGDVRFNEKQLLLPLGWSRQRRIFWNAHGDLFHENVPDEWIDRVFAVCALAHQHQHLILTKRSDRMRAYIDRACGRVGDAVMRLREQPSAVKRGLGPNGLGPVPHLRPGATWWPLPNVWLGVSVEDQARADQRIPDLLATPAAVRWLSCEPLIGSVELGCVEPHHDWLPPNEWTGIDMIDALAGEGLTLDEDGEVAQKQKITRIDWVVAGGESGPGARPMHPDWPRYLRQDCREAKVPFFFKQWGAWAPFDGQRRTASPLACQGGVMERVGKKQAGRLLDGVEWSEYPA